MGAKDRLALLLAILAGVALGVLGTSTFAPEPASSDPAFFSAMRAMRDVERIAAEPHPTGSPANARVRHYLKQRLASLGLNVTEQVSDLSERAASRLAKWSGNSGASPPAISLSGTLPGRDRSLPAVMLMAHYDSVWGSPGAPDDAAGVAAILETVRALSTDGPPARDVMVLFTDAEELGLDGARAFFGGNPVRERVGAVINLEARGGGGRSTLFETSGSNGNAVRRYADAVGRPAGSSLSVFVYKLLPNDTDLSEALTGGYVAYNLSFIGRPGLYHSPQATPARLDKGSVQDIGEQTLALTRALAVADPLPAPAPDLVFFDLFGLAMVHYPGWAGWIMLAIAAGGFALPALKNGETPRPSGHTLGAAVRMIALLVLTGVVLYALNALSGAGAEANYYDRLAALPRLEAIALAGGLACFFAVFVRWGGGAHRMAAAALPFLLLAGAAQAIAPVAVFFLVVPLTAVGLGQLGRIAGNPMVGRVTATIAAALVTGFMIQFGHQLVQGVGDTMLAAAALPLTIAALAWLPLWTGVSRRRALIVVTGLGALAVALALWVRLDPLAPTVAVYSAGA